MLLFIRHFSLLKIFYPKAWTVEEGDWFIELGLETNTANSK